MALLESASRVAVALVAAVTSFTMVAPGCSAGGERDDAHPPRSDGGGDGSGGAGATPGPMQLAELCGYGLASQPGFRFVQNFNDDQAVAIAIWPDQLGALPARCDVYVVAAKTAAEWQADNTLSDVRASGPSAIDIDGALVSATIAAPGELSSAAGAGLGVAYDVVLDCDGDGVAGEGDVLDGGGSEAGLYRTADTTVPGPHAVTMVSYSGGSFLGQRTFYPTAIAELGALPLVVVTHGWSYTHTYYDYIGEHLASYGYVVMAHEAQVQDGGPPGTLTAGDDTLRNTDYLLANLASIAGGVLDGHVDSARIMFTGHSTGGEAVVRAVTALRDGSFVSPHFGYDDVRIVSSMAPVSWHSRTLVDPGDKNFHMFVAGADDDVSGAPEPYYTQCLSIYERAHGERQLTYIHGAGHGDLLSCCGALYVDSSAPALIGRAETNRVARGYFLPLAEKYLRDNPAARDYFRRSYGDYHPSGIASHVVVSNEHRSARAGAVVLDDFEGGPSLDVTSAGAPVSFDVAGAAEILLQDNDSSFQWTGNQPSNGMTRARHAGDDPHALVFDWSTGADHFYEQAVPQALTDFSSFEALSFRVSQGTRHPETVALGGPLSFSVTLRDADGTASTLPLAAPVPPPYARAGFGAGAGWQNEFVTQRLRLRDFAATAAIDLTRVVALRFELGASFGSPRGRVAIDDIELLTGD